MENSHAEQDRYWNYNLLFFPPLAFGFTASLFSEEAGSKESEGCHVVSCKATMSLCSSGSAASAFYFSTRGHLCNTVGCHMGGWLWWLSAKFAIRE